jgi:UDP-N-acetylmuramyl tripeptide synthase
MLLIKNPTGLNQVIQTYLLKEKDRLLVFVINDNFADGRDISWLWDAAFEDLKGYMGKVIVGGTRAYDMALRLKYAGLKGVSVEPDESKLMELIEKNSTKRSKVFILPTYTAMLSIRSKIVSGDEKAKEFWQ